MNMMWVFAPLAAVLLYADYKFGELQGESNVRSNTTVVVFNRDRAGTLGPMFGQCWMPQLGPEGRKFNANVCAVDDRDTVQLGWTIGENITVDGKHLWECSHNVRRNKSDGNSFGADKIFTYTEYPTECPPKGEPQ